MAQFCSFLFFTHNDLKWKKIKNFYNRGSLSFLSGVMFVVQFICAATSSLMGEDCAGSQTHSLLKRKKMHHLKIHLRKQKFCCEAIKRQTKVSFYFSLFLFSSIFILRLYQPLEHTSNTNRKTKKKNWFRYEMQKISKLNQIKTLRCKQSKQKKNTQNKRTQVPVVGVSLKSNTFLVPIFRSQKRERSRRAREIELSQ